MLLLNTTYIDIVEVNLSICADVKTKDKQYLGNGSFVAFSLFLLQYTDVTEKSKHKLLKMMDF